MDESTKKFVVKIVVLSVAFMFNAVVAVMLIGLFDPIVDNREIFKIIGPAFSTVVGAFVGFLSGFTVRK